MLDLQNCVQHLRKPLGVLTPSRLFPQFSASILQHLLYPEPAAPRSRIHRHAAIGRFVVHIRSVGDQKFDGFNVSYFGGDNQGSFA